MRFSWIEVEWERRYIREAKDIILKLVRLHRLSAHSVLSHDLQMWRYRNQKLSTSEVLMTDPLPPTQPAPVSGIKPAPTRFKVQDSVYNKKSTHREFSVESEFQKYTLGSISSEETSILRFWEVRYDWMVFDAMTHSLNRLIRRNSRRFSQSPWITFRSRQHLYHVSVYFLQQRTQTPQSETESAQFSWRPYKCWNTYSRKNASTSWKGGRQKRWPWVRTVGCRRQLALALSSRINLILHWTLCWKGLVTTIDPAS